MSLSTMSKRKVIEDSDDGDDDEPERDRIQDGEDGEEEGEEEGFCTANPTKSADINGHIPNKEVPASLSFTSRASCSGPASVEKLVESGLGSGSGSSGRLYHEIREARSRMMETTPQTATTIATYPENSSTGSGLPQEDMGSSGTPGCKKRKRRSRSLGREDEEGKALKKPHERSSSCTTISPSKTIMVEEEGHDMPTATRLDANDEEGLLPVGAMPPMSKCKPSVVVSERLIAQTAGDSASERGSEIVDEYGAASEKKNKGQKSSKTATHGQDLDENETFGLPTENYQPRPSRSRSGRANEELVVPIDFSKCPEKLGKNSRKPKKKKSTELAIFEDGDESEGRQSCRKTNGQNGCNDLQDSGDERNSNAPLPGKSNQAEQNLAQVVDNDGTKIDGQRPSKKSRGRPKKIPVNHQGELNESEAGMSCREDLMQPETTDVETEETANMDRTTIPKTKTVTAVDVSTIDVPETTDQNRPTGQPPPSPSSTNTQQNQPQPHAQPPETPSKSTRKGPDKHSPINSNGKVAYRVGLSKRARIEPLLRIVRK